MRIYICRGQPRVDYWKTKNMRTVSECFEQLPIIMQKLYADMERGTSSKWAVSICG